MCRARGGGSGASSGRGGYNRLSVSTPQPGDPGGGKAPNEAGSKSEEGKKGRRARFRRRLALPRPSVRRPRLPRPRLRRRKEKPAEVVAPWAPKPKPKPPGDLRFRLVTRLRAIRYWVREKTQSAWRRPRRA